ncbi:hypothetical protein MRB53_038661 [Persea americana]|nr:hypothetical protein MRB53_038661 [Persea americana]
MLLTTAAQHHEGVICAAVLYTGSSEIYAFGGSEPRLGAVFNTVSRLNLETQTWELVENFGEIPGVREGHTATLWQGHKVLVFGGTNEHGKYWSDLIVFDIDTARWEKPRLHGEHPQGRARHSAVICEEKLFIIGGVNGSNSEHVLEDFCYLDLKTWEWSPVSKCVPCSNHISWVHEGEIWCLKLSAREAKYTEHIWMLDWRQAAVRILEETNTGSSHAESQTTLSLGSATSTERACESSATADGAPLSITTSLYAHSSEGLFRFVVGHIDERDLATVRSSLLNLNDMEWKDVGEYQEVQSGYRWRYCAMSPSGTEAWLLGSSMESPSQDEGADVHEMLKGLLHVRL